MSDNKATHIMRADYDALTDQVANLQSAMEGMQACSEVLSTNLGGEEHYCVAEKQERLVCGLSYAIEFMAEHAGGVANGIYDRLMSLENKAQGMVS